MTTTAHKSNFGYRLGNWTRRTLARLNGFEIGVARRMQGVLPRFGYTLTRAFFLLLKLAVFVALFLVSIYVVLFLLIVIAVAIVAQLLSRPVPVEVVNWPNSDNKSTSGVDFMDVHNPWHKGYWPDHPVYDDEKSD